MELSLSENIRAMRKQKRMTQEQLAEVLGVTTGAVYKWESGLSVPELSLIVEMAGFFDVSVDALLGYRMKDDREETILKKLGDRLRSRSPEGLAEAEKAMKKYPNSYGIVSLSAELYLIYGAEAHDGKMLHRALELLEQALCLASQNSDPESGELALCGGMAFAYEALGEYEKSLDIMKKNNACGLFSEHIGANLAVFLRRPEEAEPYLLSALLKSGATLFNTIFGYVFVYQARGEMRSAREMLQWGIEFMRGIKKEAGAPDFLDKINAELFTLLSYTQLETGETEAARASIRRSRELALSFDASPDYGFSSLRFGAGAEGSGAGDILGQTAAESMETIIRLIGSEALSALWKEERKNEKK